MATAAVLVDEGRDVVVCGRRPEALDAVAERTGAHPVAVDHGPQGVRANAVAPGRTRPETADVETTAAGEATGSAPDRR